MACHGANISDQPWAFAPFSGLASERKKGFDQLQRDAAGDAGNSVYFGETPFSKILTFMADKVMRELIYLASDASVSTTWAPVWELLPEQHRSSACILLFTLVLRGVAQWQHTIVNIVSDLPFILLAMLVSPPGVACEKRKAVAAWLLSLQECCLKSHPHSDIAWKLRAFFAREFESVRNDGKCPENLWVFLVAWRSQMLSDTQYIEGLMSLLKAITSRAHRMEIALANVRMSLKVGNKITATECTALHSAIIEECASHATAQRFVPSSHTHLPPLKRHTVCEHLIGLDKERLASFSNCALRVIEKGAHMVSLLLPPDTNEILASFIAIMGYTTICFVFRGRVVTSSTGVMTFFRDDPVVATTLLDVLVALKHRILGDDDDEGIALAEKRAKPPEILTLRLKQCPIQWTWPTLTTGVLNMDEEASKTHELNWRPPSKVRPAEEEVAGAEVEGGEDWLEAMFEEVMGMVPDVEDDLAEDADASSGGESDVGDGDGAIMAPPGSPLDSPRMAPADSPLAPRRIDLACLPGGLDIIHARHATQMKAIADARANAAASAGSLLLVGAMSLIEEADHVEFIRWTRPALKEGRTVSLDKNGGIICYPDFLIKPALHPTATIAIARTPVEYERRTSDLRIKMLAWCTLLRDLALAKQFQDPWQMQCRLALFVNHF